MMIAGYDDELRRFEAEGARPLPVGGEQGYVEHEGVRIWYGVFGSGPAVILLHGGLGHSGNWGYQVPAIMERGYRVVVIDSRGHGRSTRDERPYTYERMAGDVAAVMDGLGLARAAVVGWSDGACVGLILADQAPERVAGVFFFACNMDPSGTKEFEFTPVIGRCIGRHQQDYRELSPTPDGFDGLSEAVGLMQRTQPNYSADDLGRITVPVAIAHSEYDEFVKREHAEYLARTIPGAEFVFLPGVSHFAPLQRPGEFNAAVLAFLGKVGIKHGDTAGTEKRRRRGLGDLGDGRGSKGCRDLTRRHGGHGEEEEAGIRGFGGWKRERGEGSVERGAKSVERGERSGECEERSVECGAGSVEELGTDWTDGRGWDRKRDVRTGGRNVI